MQLLLAGGKGLPGGSASGPDRARSSALVPTCAVRRFDGSSTAGRSPRPSGETPIEAAPMPAPCLKAVLLAVQTETIIEITGEI
jgi:hypothetical protein